MNERIHTLSEQELIRRKKLQELRKLGVNPYPADFYPVSHHSIEAKNMYTEKYQGKEEKLQVCIAGRIMSIRDMGKACFAVIQDSEGKVQVYVRRDEICPVDNTTLYDMVWKKFLDIGDIIGIEGYMFITKTGEVSVHAKKFVLLSKSIKPLPIVKEAEGKMFDEVSDAEFKYRQRYAHLIIDPHVKEIFRKRTLLLQTIRNFYNAMNFLEVETPVLQTIPGGASARPFVTHHHALDTNMYLRIANELYLKRLIVGGFDGVYEFSRNFRNEGMDKTHNPEFTVMEMYAAFKDYYWMMEITEQLLEKITLTLNQTTTLFVGDRHINFKAPYRRMPILEAIKKYTGENLHGKSEEEIGNIAKELKIPVDKTMGKGKLIDHIFGQKCEHHFVEPTFITDYPVETSPLTKKHRSEEGLVERFELYINGKEIANAYTELNDPIEQQHRFEEQMKLLDRGDDDAMYIDHDFLRALEYGMPPCSGIGIGIDRLIMLMTNQESIQDVLFFPQMRIENNP
ncbi:MAG: lysine--tRNA ligase [Chitinophagaceae bacterium]